jgi:formate dehydrogenase major subunit
MANPRRLTVPFLRQLAGDPLGLGRSAQSVRSEQLVARTRTADKVVQSICPYCAAHRQARVKSADPAIASPATVH